MELDTGLTLARSNKSPDVTRMVTAFSCDVGPGRRESGARISERHYQTVRTRTVIRKAASSVIHSASPTLLWNVTRSRALDSHCESDMAVLG